jgi:type II secretory ATPase GspE/PulE/Tfp pilus assembly ATPase PilB-like protein
LRYLRLIFTASCARIEARQPKNAKILVFSIRAAMFDLTASPPTTSTPCEDASVADHEVTAQGMFMWPSPPYAAYPQPRPQNHPLACEIVGLNDGRMRGRLFFMLPHEGVAHVQVPPARTTMPLRFGQFKSLALLQPLKPDERHDGDALAHVLEHRPSSDYRIQLASGGELRGRTVGHVETGYGLFLFPPDDEDGAVRRVFLPKEAYQYCEIGPRIGEVLVQQEAATPLEVEQAVQEQAALRSQKLGDILVTGHVVTPEQLIAALDRQASMPMVRIGEALLVLGLVTEVQLKQALEQQKRDRGVPLGELLVRLGFVSRMDLQAALARKMGYPVVDVGSFPVEADAVRRLPFAAAVRLNTLPLLVRGGRLIVAVEDPSGRVALDEIEFIAQLKVVPALARSGAVAIALPSIYERFGRDLSSNRALPADTSAAIEFELDDAGKLVESLERQQDQREDNDRPIEQSDNSLVRLVNTMIIEAHAQGVSDIHVETHAGREKVKIRFRKDGQLRPYLDLPHTYRSAIIARVKIMCDLDISERRKPQDGKINFAKFSASHHLELRVATIPTHHGLEDVVMRLLASARRIAVDQLGLSPANLQALKQAVERPHGMVLCVGPTGSGKTTTLHSALGHINLPERKIWTAEDPIEITQPGLRQVQVNPKIEWTFDKALRAFLRADPDVIMVGEIRDKETARTAVEASLTGHLVLSTLHTNSAPETISRLLDMGLNPFNFGDSLLAVLAQRLVRRLCSHCRTAKPATQAWLSELLADYLHVFPAGAAPSREDLLAQWTARFGRDGALLRYHSPGCDQCEDTGFVGRAGVHELLKVSRDIRRLIHTGASVEQLQQMAIADGMRTLRQDGIEKVLAGVTTIEEVRAMINA